MEQEIQQDSSLHEIQPCSLVLKNSKIDTVQDISQGTVKVL